MDGMGTAVGVLNSGLRRNDEMEGTAGGIGWMCAWGWLGAI